MPHVKEKGKVKTILNKISLQNGIIQRSVYFAQLFSDDGKLSLTKKIFVGE